LEYIPQIFNETEMNTLQKSTQILFNYLDKKENMDTYRNISNTIHLGCWRDYSKIPFITNATKQTFSQIWIKENQNIFKKFDNLFE